MGMCTCSRPKTDCNAAEDRTGGIFQVSSPGEKILKPRGKDPVSHLRTIHEESGVTVRKGKVGFSTKRGVLSLPTPIPLSFNTIIKLIFRDLLF